MTFRTRLLRLFLRDSPAASSNPLSASAAPRLPPPSSVNCGSPLNPYSWSTFSWNRVAPSRKTVLSRGFASGAFAWSSVPASRSEGKKKAIVGSCTGGSGNVGGLGIVDVREVGRVFRMAMMRGGCRGIHSQRCSRCNGSMTEDGTGHKEVPAKPPEKNDNVVAVVKEEKKAVQTVEGEGVKDLSSEEPHLDAHGNESWRSRIANIHRPTKDEMLAAATSFFERLRIITKWSLIRQMRPYNFDEIGAFFSWLLLGQILWILLGTTTFVSLVVFLEKTVSAQEFIARAVGNYLTRETGTRVVFESAIVPRWKDGCIQFKNVFVSRRPGSHHKVLKGSAGVAAAAAQAAITAEHGHAPTGSHQHEEDDGNYTQFDVTIDTVNVTLSLARWMNGKGLLSACEIKGVRGVVDRTHVTWDPDVEPSSYKREHAPGDFEIDSFKLEDVLVTLYNPDDFRPFNISIFSADLPQLRKQWLFYDFLSANHISGSYDDSLFTIHPRQGPTVVTSSTDSSATKSYWKKTNRLRIDGLKIDHLNRGIEGPFSWIVEAEVDIVCDVTFPAESGLDLSGIVSEIVQRVEETVTSSPTAPSSTTTTTTTTTATSTIPSSPSSPSPSTCSSSPEKYTHISMSVNLNDVRAAVPLFPKELSYVNIALIRPIVAYLNSRRGAYIPVSFSVVKPLDNFDGSWSIYDCGLMDDLSAETYNAFVQSVQDQQARRRRMKRVGLWSLQVLVQILGLAMAGNLA